LVSVDKEIVVLGECESVKEAVVVAKACKPELVFLDINLTKNWCCRLPFKTSRR